MELDVDHGIHAEEQFWDELDETLSRECETHSHIDDVLRSYLTLIDQSKEKFLETDYDLGRCAFKLAASPLYHQHADYVRRQFIYCLFQEDYAHLLLLITSFLLADARTTERTFELLNEEGAFPKLVDLVQAPKQGNEAGLHRLLMELLYEMSRIQKISLADLACVTDDFIRSLFDIIEQVSHDVSDPYHYPVIRVLLVLNEQFMVAAHDPEYATQPIPLTNKVVKVLSAQGSRYKTFGENIILLLNREDETSLQLLTLKLLYLLFTTPPTYEYFYTNDLHVLVDILIRNLLDLPEEASALRHTYLRVLYPLLEHTQLQQPPQYKRTEIRKLLTVLSGAGISETPDSPDSTNHWTHFDAIDDTTKRLVRRCKSVSWIVHLESEVPEQTQSPVDESGSVPSSPVSPSKPQPPALPAPRKLKKRDSSKASTLTIGSFLSPQLESARQSSLSVMEMAAQKEKPGVITPSRNPSLKHGLRAAIMNKKEKPPVPKARRSGLGRAKLERADTDLEVTKTNISDTQISETSSANDTDQKLSADNNLTTSPEDVTSSVAKPPDSTKYHPPAPQTQQKKPPPAPKRRWRGKRAKEEDEGGGSHAHVHTHGSREPGKFSTNLPSIITTTAEKVEISPFSPIEEHKTLSPTSPEGGSLVAEQKSSIAEALGQAQAIAVTGIAETLEKATISPPTSPDLDDGDSSEGGSGRLELRRTETIDEVLEEYGLHPSNEEHETHSSDDIEGASPRKVPNEMPQQQAVLAPPNQAPPREIPSPKWELERSPFLSEEEDEGESGAEKPAK